MVAVSSVCPGACEKNVQLHLDCRTSDSWLLRLLRRLHGYLSHVGTTVDRHTVGFYGCVHPTSEVIMHLGQRRKRQGPRHRRPREHATHSQRRITWTQMYRTRIKGGMVGLALDIHVAQGSPVPNRPIFIQVHERKSPNIPRASPHGFSPSHQTKP